MAVNVGDLLRRAHGLWEYIDEGGDGAKRLRELERDIVQAHIRETALVQENAELKQTVADYERFEVEKDHYVPKQKASSAWVFEARPGANADSHFAQAGMEFCAHCFRKRKLSILQPVEKRGSVLLHVACHECGADIVQDKPPTGFAEFC